MPTSPTRIASVAAVLPRHRYRQHELTEAFARLVLPDGHGRNVLERFHQASRVEHRHLARPIEAYAELDGFGAANDTFVDVGLELGESAVRRALARAGLRPADVDVIMSVSVTGVATPSLDARLVGRLGLREDVRRVPVFGLGCVAGAAGIARVHDLLAGDPDAVGVLLSVELCSLTLQRDDASTPNLVASGLFGDGAAAAVVVGAERARRLGLGTPDHPAPAVVATRSRFYPDTERVMGWDVGGSGFRIVLAASVAEVVEEHLGDDVRGFLEEHHLKTGDIRTWVAHPGGPKVLEAMARTLDLPPDALALSWRSLAERGNLSSASVLHVLAETMATRAQPAGTPGLMLAMGPGFCSELVLLEW